MGFFHIIGNVAGIIICSAVFVEISNAFVLPKTTTSTGSIIPTTTTTTTTTSLYDLKTSTGKTDPWWKASSTAKAQTQGGRGGGQTKQKEKSTTVATSPPQQQQQQQQRRRFSYQDIQQTDGLVKDISDESNDMLKRHPMNQPGHSPTSSSTTAMSRGVSQKTSANSPWERSSSFPRTGTTAITDGMGSQQSSPRGETSRLEANNNSIPNSQSRLSYFEVPTNDSVAPQQQQQQQQQQQGYPPSSMTGGVQPADYDYYGRGETLYGDEYHEEPSPPSATSGAPWDAYHTNVMTQPKDSTRSQQRQQQQQQQQEQMKPPGVRSPTNNYGSNNNNNNNWSPSPSSSLEQKEKQLQGYNGGIISDDEFVRSLLNTDDDDFIDDDDDDHEPPSFGSTGNNMPGRSFSNPGGAASSAGPPPPVGESKPSNQGFSNTMTNNNNNPMSRYSPGQPPNSPQGAGKVGSPTNTRDSYNSQGQPMSGYAPGMGRPAATDGSPNKAAGLDYPSSWKEKIRAANQSQGLSRSPTTTSTNPKSGYSPGSSSMGSPRSNSANSFDSTTTRPGFGATSNQASAGGTPSFGTAAADGIPSFGTTTARRSEPEPRQGYSTSTTTNSMASSSPGVGPSSYEPSAYSSTGIGKPETNEEYQNLGLYYDVLQAEIRELKTTMASMAKQHANVMGKLLDVEEKLDRCAPTTTTTAMTMGKNANSDFNPTTGSSTGSSNTNGETVPSSFFFGNNKYSG